MPIKIEQIPFIKNEIENYKKLKWSINELAKINAELLRYKGNR